MNTERHDLVLRLLQAQGPLLSPEAVAEAIEVALSWQPEPAPIVSRPTVIPSRWSCGCDATECVMRRDQMQDAGGDPHAIVSFTCIGHGLVGKSHPGRVADGLLRLEAQAMLMLDRAHQEQCR